MKTLLLHNSCSQELFVRITVALQNVAVSGTSMHIKYRLMRRRKTSPLSSHLLRLCRRINIADRTLAPQSFLHVFASASFSACCLAPYSLLGIFLLFFLAWHFFFSLFHPCFQATRLPLTHTPPKKLILLFFSWWQIRPGKR